MKKLNEKLAIITGGAMGNGLGVAKTFLKYGANIVILDYAKEVAKTVLDLKGMYPNQEIKGYEVDIRDKEKLENIIKEVYENMGEIDILVNNAGVCQLETFANMSDEVRDFHMDINIKGTWNVTKCVLPYMKKNSESSIINLSSVTGPRVADVGEVAYATTKAAIIGFTKALAMELVNEKIRVNAILPGYILTPMVEKIGEQSNPDNPREIIDGIVKGIPMKRMGTIEELGELAAFLASNESSYFTGAEFVIDGGSTLPETMVVGV